MCIAILAPKGQVVPTETLVRCFNGNRDGGGFAFMKKGKVKIDKGYMTLPNFINRYRQLIDANVHNQGPMLIHCRIATIGKVGPDNCHPFKLKEGALIHNGSLWWDYHSDRTSEKSDTRIFSERLHNVLTYEDIVIDPKPLEKLIAGDKMAMLFNGGNYVILGEDRGVWHEGVWYSHSGPLGVRSNLRWRGDSNQ